MFKNEFVLSGICKRANEMKNDKGQVQGLYFSIASIGDSYSMYAPVGCPGYDDVREDEFLEVTGHLKTKIIVKSEKGSSIAGLSVDKITVQNNPLNR